MAQSARARRDFGASAQNRDLLSAARRGSVEQMQKLLKAGGDPNAVNSDGERAIAVAVASDRADVVRLLLSAKASTADAGDWSLVSIAAENKSWNALRALLAAGVDVNSCGRVGPGALEVAARAGRLDLVRELLDAGADPNARANRDALEDAIVEGHEEVALALLEAGAKLTPPSRKQEMLAVAAETGCQRVIDALLHAQGSPSTSRSQVFTALRRAGKARVASMPDHAAADLQTASQRPEFREAVSAIQRLTGRQPKPMKQVPGVVYFATTLKEARKIVLKHQRQYVKRDSYLFVSEGSLGLAPTADPYEVIAALGIRGEDPSHGTAQIIHGLKELARQAPFQILAAEHDSMIIRFDALVEKPLAAARRILSFCPEFETAGPLAQRLEKEQELTLWWD